ncbi:hypothetical protein M8J77_003371 [Diaphorina citri]|nr:hypothetical protein M8J77_003371 [Diaphorina citri]
MRRNACAQTNEAGVMNYNVIAYGSICRDVKVYDLPWKKSGFLYEKTQRKRRGKEPTRLNKIYNEEEEEEQEKEEEEQEEEEQEEKEKEEEQEEEKEEEKEEEQEEEKKEEKEKEEEEEQEEEKEEEEEQEEKEEQQEEEEQEEEEQEEEEEEEKKKKFDRFEGKSRRTAVRQAKFRPEHASVLYYTKHFDAFLPLS